jgi:hypothetical protein
MTLFISYSRRDNDVVARLRSALGQAGATIWIDHEQLKPCTPGWEEAVRNGIAWADADVYVASPDTRNLQYVRDELATALDDQKPVYPFWVAGEKWYDCAPVGWGATRFADGRGVHYVEGP